jgi:hypothetical protein
MCGVWGIAKTDNTFGFCCNQEAPGVVRAMAIKEKYALSALCLLYSLCIEVLKPFESDLIIDIPGLGGVDPLDPISTG